MKKENKDLLLKDLCARLSYGVIIEYNNDSCVETREMGLGSLHDFMVDNAEVKPYLRPISSMTDEEMDKLFDILHIDKDGKDDDWIKINDDLGIKFFFPTGKWIKNVADAYDYLYSIHIDFRGLIPKGLAIEVTKDNNPYK